MAASEAGTVSQYLASMEPDRRAAIERVRRVVNEHLPAGFEEVMQYGMISWVVPRARFPDTYNGQPLAIASLASQKGHASLYLMGVYADARARAAFEQGFRAAGKKLDTGKSCVRFRSADDLALDAVGAAIGGIGLEGFLDAYARARGPANTKAAAETKPAAKTKKPAAKTKKPAAKTKKPAAKTKKPAVETARAAKKKASAKKAPGRRPAR